jgi:competence protein ComEC
MFLTLAALWRVTASSSTVQVSYLDVGQGDSALIQSPDGFNILIDGGTGSAGPTVVAYLQKQNISDIDVLLASHNDSDHVGGLIDILEANDIDVNEVRFNGYPGTSNTYQQFATAVANEGLSLIPIQYPQEYQWGLLDVFVLHPPPELTDPSQNDASVVLLVEYGDQRFLFTGDIGETVEAQILGRQTPVAASVLKVAHHGSDSSSGQAFLAAVAPQEAVISVGQNSYGHPAQEVIERLVNNGARIWRTDWNGDIWVGTDGTTLTISSLITDFLFMPQTLNQFNPARNGIIQILTILADGAGSTEPDEYVELRNEQAYPIALTGWMLQDQDANFFTIPEFYISPGQICRVYTNEIHPEYCGFNWASSSSIWDNSGECAELRDENNTLIDSFCY